MMVKAVICAPRGAMGSLIVQEAAADSGIQITGCVGSPGRDYIGQDAGLVAGLGRKIGVAVSDDIEKVIDSCDLVVDFSTVEFGMEILRACVSYGRGLICGTTGFTEEQTKELLAAGETIPMMKAANTSYVVNVMRKLVGMAAEKLGDRCTIEIIDLHSETKKDAPSGTAIELAEEVAAKAPDKTLGDIPFHSVRAGNTPSEHRVIFGCMGEKMEIAHEVYDWRCYASGVCGAMKYMGEKIQSGEKGGIGLYTMEDVIGL